MTSLSAMTIPAKRSNDPSSPKRSFWHNKLWETSFSLEFSTLSAIFRAEGSPRDWHHVQSTDTAPFRLSNSKNTPIAFVDLDLD